MYYFTTYFDKNYLSRGLVLYNSLKRHCEKFSLYVLCLDNEVYDYFQFNNTLFPEVVTIRLTEIEEYDLELKACKTNRSVIEYYFTLSPCLPLYVLKRYNVSHICSLDADIMFFSSPAKIFSHLENYSVLITPHNFSSDLIKLEIYGIYNVSFQIFKNDVLGIKCLEDWRNQCINWCYDKLEGDKFADQKYLDKWISNYQGVLSIPYFESGVAPWNLNSFSITNNDIDVFINEEKLIFYHYQGLRIIGHNFINHGLGAYNVKSTRIVATQIYKPYIKSILNFDMRNDFEIKRNNYYSKSLLLTALLQKDWYFYTSGILFHSAWLSELIGNSLYFVKKLIQRCRN